MINKNKMYLLPGDIVLTRSNGTIGKLIRVFTKSGNESETMVNHVGMVDTTSYLCDATMVEAVDKVRVRKILEYYGSNTGIEYAIYRPTFLDHYRRKIVIDKLNSYVNKNYGYLKIVTHFLDYCIGGKYFFRKLAKSDDYPICSWVVAYAYDSIGFKFGVDPQEASPDDIWDFVVSHPEYFKEIKKLGL